MKMLSVRKMTKMIDKEGYSWSDMYVQICRRIDNPPVYGTLTNWLTEKSRMPADMLPVIADIVGADPGDFFIDEPT